VDTVRVKKTRSKQKSRASVLIQSERYALAFAGIELVSIGKPLGSDAALHWKSMSKTEVASSGSGSAALGDEIVGRINQLGAISETPEHLARFSFRPNIAPPPISFCHGCASRHGRASRRHRQCLRPL